MAQPSSSLSPDPGECYRRYFPRVFAYIYGRTHDARATEDLTSQVFESVLAKAPSLTDDESLAVQFFTAAREILASHLRSRSRADLQDAAANALLLRPDVARVLDRLRKFSQRQQDIIALKFDAELTNAQIARVMHLPEGKVGVTLYRALRKLRKALEQDG